MKKIFILLLTLASLASIGQVYVYRDYDGDGFGDPNYRILFNVLTSDTIVWVGRLNFVDDNTDCDDYNASVKPNTEWYKDADDDGYTDGTIIRTCYQPAGYTAIPRRRESSNGYFGVILIDCYDDDANRNEIVWYTDNDGDGYKQPDIPLGASYNLTTYSRPITSCTMPVRGNIRFTPDFLIKGIDCDDTDPNVYRSNVYLDADGDGFPSTAPPEYRCISPSNPQVPPYYFASQLNSLAIDCDDLNATIIPTTVWYKDKDGDGYASEDSVVSCVQPSGYILNPVRNGNLTPIPNNPSLTIDCNDNDALSFPFQNWIQDNDGDGYGKGLLVGGEVRLICDRPGARWFALSELLGDNDCDDNIASIKPTTEWCIDADIDGYYTGTKIIQCSSPGPGYLVAGTKLPGDCNDNDANINPATLWVLDEDDDGYRSSLYISSGVGSCTPPQDGRHYISNSKGSDCNDNDARYNSQTVSVIDKDGDGYYSGDSIIGCPLVFPEGIIIKTTQLPGDCNDSDTAINPATLWVLDEDGDGYKSRLYFADPSGSCTPPQDGRHYINNSKGSDCNDNDATDNPETVWVMDADGDGYYIGEPYTGCFVVFTPGYVRKTTQLPGDCNDANGDIKPATKWYKDADNDGYSDGATLTQCTQPPNYKMATGLTAITGDCNDGIATINPGAPELCDGIDNNCDGLIDEGVKTTFYRDNDGDTYGNPSVTIQACSLPSGYVTNNTDCNDASAAINPTTVWILDADADGYYSGTPIVRCTSPGNSYIIRSTQLAGDCSDNNASVNPAAAEVCGNRIDDNCNGIIDEATCNPCRNATNLQTTNVTSNSAQLNWTAVANAVQWQVQYKTTKQGSKWVDVFVPGNKRFVIRTGLLSNQNYQWQIRAKCGTTWTAYSAAAAFRTTAGSSLGRPGPTTDEPGEPMVPAISIYPNPGNGIFNLHLQLSNTTSGTAAVSVLDMAGRKIYAATYSLTKGSLDKRIQLPAGASQGMYLVEVITDDKRYTSKLVLVK